MFEPRCDECHRHDASVSARVEECDGCEGTRVSFSFCDACAEARGSTERAADREFLWRAVTMWQSKDGERSQVPLTPVKSEKAAKRSALRFSTGSRDLAYDVGARSLGYRIERAEIRWAECESGDGDEL